MTKKHAPLKLGIAPSTPKEERAFLDTFRVISDIILDNSNSAPTEQSIELFSAASQIIELMIADGEPEICDEVLYALRQNKMGEGTTSGVLLSLLEDFSNKRPIKHYQHPEDFKEAFQRAQNAYGQSMALCQNMILHQPKMNPKPDDSEEHLMSAFDASGQMDTQHPMTFIGFFLGAYAYVSFLKEAGFSGTEKALEHLEKDIGNMCDLMHREKPHNAQVMRESLLKTLHSIMKDQGLGENRMI